MRQKKTTMAAVPGGCTKLLQPADVSWNAPFKAAYRAAYDNWLANGDHTYTAGGNMRGAPKEHIVSMVKEAWSAVQRESIMQSFDVCGITTSDIDAIHCTKVGGIAAAARGPLSGYTRPESDNANSDSDSGASEDEIVTFEL
jgi:hypothetical protein